MANATHQGAADRLYAAYGGALCEPVRFEIGDTVEAGYAVQAINTARWLKAGRRISGRKIGLTSKAVQTQMGVDQPDFGVLFADMEVGDGEEVDVGRLQQPRAEAEIAFVLGKDLDMAAPTLSDVARAIAFAVPAVEIVGSRIKNWDIAISDTIADNASSGLYVLGGTPRKLDDLDLIGCGMTMRRNGRPCSFGSGAACLGSPLNAAVWLARQVASRGAPLREGEVLLSGALGPMVAAAPGDAFEAMISGLGSVRALFSPDVGKGGTS